MEESMNTHFVEIESEVDMKYRPMAGLNLDDVLEM